LTCGSFDFVRGSANELFGLVPCDFVLAGFRGYLVEMLAKEITWDWTVEI
jgi:hypothetical protein